MATCNCVGASCSCVLLPAVGVAISGSGTQGDPYVVESAGLVGLFTVEDTATVNMSLLGGGTQDNPFLVRGDSTVRLLSDLSDMTPGPAPVAGDTIVAVGDGTWRVAATPIVATPGETEHGLYGSGLVVDPIGALWAGTWGVGLLAGAGTDDTIGDVLYVDTAGQVRAQPRPQSRAYRLTGTWNRPELLKAVTFTLIGGGGAGGGAQAVVDPGGTTYQGSAGGGGGGGATLRVTYGGPGTTIPSTAIPTIGAGGVGVVPVPGSALSGGPGGETRLEVPSLGLTLRAGGGSGGGSLGQAIPAAQNGIWAPGGAGGTATAAPGAVLIPGQTGNAGLMFSGFGLAGAGGGTTLAARTAERDAVPGVLPAAGGAGGGGSGAQATNWTDSAYPASAGGNGQDGVIIVEEWF